MRIPTNKMNIIRRLKLTNSVAAWLVRQQILMQERNQKMEGHRLVEEKIAEFVGMLKSEERAAGTIQKYLRDIRAFAKWLAGREVTKELAAAWREELLSSGCAPATVNSKLSPLNDLFRFLGWGECRVKFLKIQRQIFRDQSRVLGKEEYLRLLKAAGHSGQKRLELLIETICATGIRVSEVKYITVEAAGKGKAEIHLKGKIRIILIPGQLCRKLWKYAQKQKINSGEIFVTKSKKSLSRKQIWQEMKKLCIHAGVEASKVFPHNLRHLFAVTFYRACKDIVKLADILGHSSIETTRIYLLTSGEEHARQLEGLGLVS